MEPTPHAETLIEPLQQALDLLRTTLSRQIVFDPLTSERTFRVGLLDISQIVMLPRLVNHIRSTAPNVRITSMHITQDIANMLESGAVDLAVGFIPQLQAGFYEQTLFGQDFVCIAARNHPFIDDQLTLEEFQQAKHIVVNIEGTGHGIVEKSLEKQQIQRNVALRLPSFLGISFIVQSTDLLATVPRLLAEKLVQHNDVKLLELPMELPIYKVKQHWHERYHRDPGVMWLRKVFANLFMQ